MACSAETRTQYYATLGRTTVNLFRQIKDVNPGVLHDLKSIFEKFPCNEWIAVPLDRTVSVGNSSLE